MEPTMGDGAEELLHTYTEDGGINYLAAAAMLPSRSVIDDACAELMSLMFPGFRGEPLAGFFSELPALRKMLWTDIDAAYEGDPAAKSYEEIILAYPALEAITIQRMAHELYLQELPLIPRIMTEWAHSRTGIDIHPGAKIGSHFFIDHGTGVVIGETSEIGKRVKLYHSVTLGARSFQKDEHGKIKKGGKRHPTVEDDVTIYPGSTILGGQAVIGARSTIGGNVFLVQSVPADSLVYYEEKQLRIVPKRKKKPTSSRDEFSE